MWSLSDGCFVIPQYDGANPDLVAPLVSQVSTMLGTGAEVLQIVDTAKYIANATTGTTTCPTGMAPNDPTDPDAVKCQSQPPYTESLPPRLTVISLAAMSPLEPQTGNVMDIINSAPDGTCFWVLTDAANHVYTVTFPPPPQSP